MRISEHFGLNKSQYELDFIDIDPARDLPLFLDPYFLSIRTDRWSINASRTIRSFFEYFLSLIRGESLEQAREIFSHLHEPNETCLGLSKTNPQGRGVGEEDANRIFESLLESKAVKSGMIEDLEDCRLFVPGVDKDKISDMTTNIIRLHLVEYTQTQAKNWGIPLQENVPTGFYWRSGRRVWENTYTNMLVLNDQKILLIPKAIVSYANKYSAQTYHQHFVLNFLQHRHLKMNSILVQRRILKNGAEKIWVSKASVRDHEAPLDKEYLTKFTDAHSEIFRDFRKKAHLQHSPRGRLKLSSVSNEELTPQLLSNIVEHLITELGEIPTGPENATRYHRTAAGILELLFYSRLICPQIEKEIHEGRKRIDITFDNAAEEGFFFRLHNTHGLPAQFIFVECKNYSNDPKNPELDQIQGRFSVNRGKFGILVCRSISDFDTFIKRCADTYHDGRGLVIPLTDNDLIEMLQARSNGTDNPEESILQTRFREIGLR